MNAPFHISTLTDELNAYPFDWRMAADLLEQLPPDSGHEAHRAALLAAAHPGAAMTPATADAALELLHRTAAAAEAQRRQREEAFAEARRLMDLFGEQDPRAMHAVINAISLIDPGYMDSALVECNIHLPAPTHHTEAGVPLFSLDAIAEALDADPDGLTDLVVEMEAADLVVRAEATGRLQ